MCVVQVFTVSPALVERVLQRLVCLVAEEIHRIFKEVEQFSYSGALHVSVHIDRWMKTPIIFCNPIILPFYVQYTCRRLLR